MPPPPRRQWSVGPPCGRSSNGGDTPSPATSGDASTTTAAGLGAWVRQVAPWEGGRGSVRSEGRTGVSQARGAGRCGGLSGAKTTKGKIKEAQPHDSEGRGCGCREARAPINPSGLTASLGIRITRGQPGGPDRRGGALWGACGRRRTGGQEDRRTGGQVDGDRKISSMPRNPLSVGGRSSGELNIKKTRPGTKFWV